MSIATEISRLQTAKANIKAAIESKGVSVPSGATLDTYGVYIDEVVINLIKAQGMSGHFTIPDGTLTIKNYAFTQSRITGVTIPDSVRSINAYAFNGCTLLQEITFPSYITNTGNYVCNGCTSLTSVTLPSGLTTVGTGAFTNCQNLENIVIPANVATIGGGAFSGCTGLKYVQFLGTTPPNTTNANFLGGATTYDFPIYVPDEAVDTYKAKQYYTGYAHRIFGVSEMPPESIEGYEILDYIEGDGTFYIPTNVLLTNSQWWEYKFQMTTLPGTTQQHLFSGVSYRTAQINSSGNFYVRRGDLSTGGANTVLTTGNTLSVGTDRTVACFRNGDGIYVDNVLNKSLAADAVPTDSVSAWFFTVNHSSDVATYGAKGKLYYMKIGQGNSALYNFIPAKRNSDNNVGLYDAVNNVFYPSVSVN